MKLVQTNKLYEIEEEELKKLLKIPKTEKIMNFEFHKLNGKWEIKTEKPKSIKLDITTSTTSATGNY